MARSDKRYSVYQKSRAVCFIGETASQLNAAIERYALLQRLLAAPEEVQGVVWDAVEMLLNRSIPVVNGGAGK